jgi:hypothetical protein
VQNAAGIGVYDERGMPGGRHSLARSHQPGQRRAKGKNT